MFVTHRKQAGRFTVTISEPAPRWIKIECDNGDAFYSLSFEDASDLVYALKRAVKLAKAEDARINELNKR